MSFRPHSGLPGSSSHRRPRKISAYRSPYSTFSSSSGSSSASSSSSIGPTRTTSSSATASHSPYPTPTILLTLLQDSAPVQYEHLFASTNTRYPGAPGTALAKAREASIKAAQAAKREADKKRRDREELIRLGVGEKMGKRSRDTNSAIKRSESPFTSNANANSSSVNGNSVASTNSATRRSQRDKDKTGDSESQNGGRSRGTSVARSPALNGHNSESIPPQSNDHLSVPGVTHTLSGTGRIRKPASRGNSPVPLTEAHKSPERNVGTTSSSTPHGLGLSGYHLPTNNGTAVHAANRLGAAITTQPFQSSPLARDSIKSFPTPNAENEAAETPTMMTTRSRNGSSVSHSPLIKPQKNPSDLAADDQIGGGGLDRHDAVRQADQADAEVGSTATTRGEDVDMKDVPGGYKDHLTIPDKTQDDDEESQGTTTAAGAVQEGVVPNVGVEDVATVPESSPVLPAGITA